MKALSHERARHLLHARPADLSSGQQADLADHLAGCPECRAYAGDLRALQPALARAMHTRWDSQRPSAISGRAIQRRWEQARRKQQSARLIAVLAGIGAVIFFVVYGPALLSSLLSLFNTSPVAPWVTVTPVPPGPTATLTASAPTPTLEDTPLTCGSIAEPLCSVQQAEALAGFDVFVPSRLPDGVTFLGAIATPGESSTLIYRCGETCRLTIYQQKRTCAADEPCDDEFSQERQGELVILGTYVGDYLADISSAESGTAVPTEDAGARSQVLQWPSGIQTSEFGFRISQTGSTTAANRLDRVGLIELAENLLGIPSASGLIAFETIRDGNAEIYVREYRSEEPTNLTNNPATDRSFAWSPDGGRIAFLSDRAGAAEVFVMEADGSNVVQLTEASGVTWIGPPAWSPDGERVALTGAAPAYGEGAGLVYLVSTDGSGYSVLSYSPIADGPIYTTQPLRWSPDGKWIAYTENFAEDSFGNPGASSGLKVIAVEGGRRTKLHRENVFVSAFEWSPDGRKLAYAENFGSPGPFEIMVKSADGSGFLGGCPDEVEGDLAPTDLAWSPDGGIIAYFTLDEYGFINLALCDWQANSTIGAAGFPGSGLSRISWSPEGLQILFEMDSPEPPEHWIAATMLIKTDGQLSIVGNTALELSEIDAGDNTNPQWQPRPKN